MTQLTKIATAALSATALGIVVAACQPQGGPVATDEAPAAAAVASAAVEAPEALTAAEQTALLVGNTLIGSLESFNLTWAEYFAPDGTARALVRFEGEADMEVSGTHYSNDRGEYCTEYAEMEQKFGQTVFCNRLVALGDGRYQQLFGDGSKGAVYEQFFEGEQIDAFR